MRLNDEGAERRDRGGFRMCTASKNTAEKTDRNCPAGEDPASYGGDKLVQEPNERASDLSLNFLGERTRREGPYLFSSASAERSRIEDQGIPGSSLTLVGGDGEGTEGLGHPEPIRRRGAPGTSESVMSPKKTRVSGHRSCRKGNGLNLQMEELFYRHEQRIKRRLA